MTGAAITVYRARRSRAIAALPWLITVALLVFLAGVLA